MYTPIYWIDDNYPGRLGLMARPRGGDWLDDEMRALRHAGVDLLVSLLTETEQVTLDLLDEADACAASQIAFCSLPILDRQVPPLNTATITFVRDLACRREQGAHLVLHCRMGIGWSALIAASVLVVLGMPAAAAWAQIEQARGCPVPDTPEQRAWVEQFARTISMANPEENA
jgi:protein-tyrosine phosphatase